MKKIALLDMDGVLCDFVGHACALHGRPELVGAWPAGAYDMHTVLGVSSGAFWRKISATPDFWRTIPPYPWYLDLFALVREYGYMPVIATAPSLDPRTAAGKVAWIQEKLGTDFRNYFIGAKKHMLAAPGRVLIDDSEHQIDAFEELCPGGAITFPRPWNQMHALSADPLAYVRERLEALSA